jgi:hypothetical protein
MSRSIHRLLACAAAALMLTAPLHAADEAVAESQPASRPARAANAAGRTIQLFNGTDLKGLVPVLAEEGADPAATWSVADGILKVTGKPNGYVRTERAFRNFKLTVEYRFPAGKFNSGVLLFCQEPDAVWPNCIEAQLMSGGAGNIILMGTAKATHQGQLMQLAEGKKFLNIPRAHEESAEKPLGEWNTMEIEAANGKLTITVNGVLENEVTDIEPAMGFIGFQSEGGPIEFRKMELVRAPRPQGAQDAQGAARRANRANAGSAEAAQ